MDIKQFSTLLGDLYREALEINGWEHFFTELGQILDFQSTSIMIDDNVGRVGKSWGINIPQEREQLYLDYYVDQDPWAPALIYKPALKFHSSNDLFPDREFVKTEIYYDFLRLDDVRWACGSYFDDPMSGQGVVIALHRGHSRQPFNRTDLDTLDRISPHIKNALSIVRRVNSGESLHKSFSNIAGISDSAAFVLNTSRHLVAKNQLAEQMFSEGFAKFDGHRLQFKSRELSNIACQLVEGMIQFTQGNSITVRRFARLGDNNSGYQLKVEAFPLPADILGQQQLGVLLLVKNTAQQPTISHAGLRDLFGLTGMESEVVSLLCFGKASATIAGQLNIKESTVRSHTKAAYAKIGVTKQTELVTVIMSSLAVRV
ncbi:MAG: LuxR C-terminal-related transcriptional regulator [Zhongshania sp.]|uniref:helix-turn-helix transcriptional regulator n=1 Tax=Zhongshania sp. TaxID=1971902 RepID=UPI00262922F1|nr:LuxR family transcriptional regulator [Zhongshania sp.]MDF1693705.1 LuxR C-terminal-related transcriptional regulator [Zhongshania sp.]